MSCVQRDKNVIESHEDFSRQRAFDYSLSDIFFVNNHRICLQCMTRFVKSGSNLCFDLPFYFGYNEMHNPTGLTPNLKIKTALTPVGVDAGVIFLVVFIL